MYACMYVFICLFIYLFDYLFIYLFMYLRVYLPILVAFAHSVRKQFRTKNMDPNPTPLYYSIGTLQNQMKQETTSPVMQQEESEQKQA